MYMSFLEPITRENINELKVGEWIWDSKLIHRREHASITFSLSPYSVTEPVGFRLIHILDLKYFPQYCSKPFMLSNFDSLHIGYTWESFEEDRYFKFKRG